MNECLGQIPSLLSSIKHKELTPIIPKLFQKYKQIELYLTSMRPYYPHIPKPDKDI